MGPTYDEITQNLAARLGWEVARRNDGRVARRLYRKPLMDGGYRLAEGALLDDFCHFLQAIGVMALRQEAHAAAIHRQMVPVVQYVLLSGVQTRLGIERVNALPSLLGRDEALMRLVGVNAQQVRQGICQRGATTRQRARLPGPLCPTTVANNLVKWSVWDLEAVFNGSSRAVATAGVFGAKVTGIAEGTELETTARDTGCSQVTRKGRLEET